MQEALFCQALGLAAPWAVERVALDVERSRIDLYVVWQATSAACPACSAADQKLHDHRQRSWRHLDFFQFEAYVHCSLPRVACSVCGATTQLSVPWAREGSRFTLMFEALALTLAREMPVSACARILRCADNTVWRQIVLVDHLLGRGNRDLAGLGKLVVLQRCLAQQRALVGKVVVIGRGVLGHQASPAFRKCRGPRLICSGRAVSLLGGGAL